MNPAIQCNAIILSGGTNKRMHGYRKAFLPIGQITLIDYLMAQLAPIFDTIMISTNEPQLYADQKVKCVEDEIKHHGPLGGILSALVASTSERNFVMACDIPDPPLALITQLYQASTNSNADITVPICQGRLQPLFGFYQRCLIPLIRRMLANHERRMMTLMDLAMVHTVDFPDMIIHNINEPEAYVQYLATLGK